MANNPSWNTGDLSTKKLVSGVARFQPSGVSYYANLGNVSMHQLQYGNQIKKHYNSRFGVKRQDAQFMTQQDPTFTIETDEEYGLNRLYQIFGTQQAAFSQSSATATVFTLAIGASVVNVDYFVGGYMTTNYSVKGGTTGTTALIAETDYHYEPQHGVVTILPGGAFDPTIHSLKVTFDSPALSRDSVLALSVGQVNGNFWLVEEDADSLEPRADWKFPCIMYSDDPGSNNADFTKFKFKVVPTGAVTVTFRQS